MKTKTIAPLKRYLILMVLCLLSTTLSFSQQVIKFKDGQVFKVVIVYQTKDTIKYHLAMDDNVIYTVSMDRVESIKMSTPLVKPPRDTVYPYFHDRTYLHYKHMCNTGIGLAAGGGVVAIIGVALLSTANNDQNNDDLGFSYFTEKFTGMIFTCLGGGLFLTGAILTITSSINMNDYKNKHKGFSFDVKYNPNFKGVSLVYRF